MREWMDILALILLGITGAIRATEHKYDWVGILTIAFVTGSGGGLIRDVLLNLQPAILVNGNYLVAVALSFPLGFLFYKLIQRIWFVFEMADALGLALFAVVGAQKALDAGLSIQSATLIGTVNAIGGGLLRDILVREEPAIFKPGQWYVSIAILAALSFSILAKQEVLSQRTTAITVILVAFAIRMLVIRLNLQTVRIKPWGYIEEKDGVTR